MAFSTTVQEQWRGKEVKVQGQRVVGRTMFEVGLVVEGQAKLLAPIDTGRLAGSITTQAYGNGTAPTGEGSRPSDRIASPTSGDMVLVGTPVEYGPYMEFGTIRNEAQPFLRPALDLAKGKKLTILMQNGRLQFKEFLR